MSAIPPDAALQQYVDEQAESAKVDYQEQWADDFGALQTGEERQAELMLAGYLLTITNGYNRVVFQAAWDAFPDPEWGTIMGHPIDVDGHSADFLFRCCLGGDRRLLAVTLDPEDTRQRRPEAIARDRGLIDARCKVVNYSDREVLGV